VSNPAFTRWWEEWRSRNEALYIEAQRERELAGVQRWARAHIEFHFGNSSNEGNDNEQNND